MGREELGGWSGDGWRRSTCRELIAELAAFEVNYTPSGNLTVDVRAREHPGDLVIATALALGTARVLGGFTSILVVAAREYGQQTGLGASISVRFLFHGPSSPLVVPRERRLLPAPIPL